jgi:arsenate reductase
MAADVTIWHNPRCSKSRGALEILQDRGVDVAEVRYLDAAPSRAELERVLSMLGTEDPTSIARRGEDRWKELGLDAKSRDEVLDAMAANPILIERPIVIRGERAVIGRPPEKVLDLLD